MIRTDAAVFTPRQRLILGLVFIPAYLLQQSILIRSVQFIILISVFILQGGKFRIIPNFMLISGIILAYTLRPAGKVLFMLVNFPVTKGALLSGITRSLMLIGLIYISRLSVSSKLKFRGTAGNLVGRVFYYFEAITEWKGKFSFKNFYKSGSFNRMIFYMDRVIEELEKSPAFSPEEVSDSGVRVSGYLTAVILIYIIINYALLLPLPFIQIY